MNRILLLIIPIIMMGWLALPARAQENAAAAALDASAGDFLDMDLGALEKEASVAYDAKEYEKAAQIYLELLRHDIRNGVVIYNLARCYGMLGDAELAAAYLVRSQRAGFDACSQAIWDPDFDSVREAPVFSDTLKLLYDSAQREAVDAKGKLELISGGALMKCYVHLPDNYDPAKKYTLLIGLHGFGDNAENFSLLWEGFAEHDFIYAALEAPYALSSQGPLTYSWTTGLPDDKRSWELSAAASVGTIGGAVTQLKGEYSVSDVYLLGFSQGATMAYYAGIVHHYSIKGVICVAGSLETESIIYPDLADANNLRVFIAHGDKDGSIPLAVSEAARDRLKALGYDVEFLKYAGIHRLSVGPLQAAERWMKGKA